MKVPKDEKHFFSVRSTAITEVFGMAYKFIESIMKLKSLIVFTNRHTVFDN